MHGNALNHCRRLAVKLALVAFACYVHAQRGAGPAGPPVAAERSNYEAKGDFDYLNSCAICHGRMEQAPSLTTLQKMSPEKIYETDHHREHENAGCQSDQRAEGEDCRVPGRKEIGHGRERGRGRDVEPM